MPPSDAFIQAKKKAAEVARRAVFLNHNIDLSCQ